MLILKGRTRVTQHQGAPLRVDPSIGADFAWVASITTAIAAGNNSIYGNGATKVTKQGIALSNGFVSINGRIKSGFSTTWTETGALQLGAGDQIVVLSARGQSASCIFSTSGFTMLLWNVVGINIGGTIPAGLVHYAVRRNGSIYSLWINGVFQGSATDGSVQNADDGTAFAIGAHSGAGYTNEGLGAVPATSGIYSVVRTPKALPDAQCLALSKNHWSAYRAGPTVMMGLPAVAAGNSYSLAAVAGAYSMVGASAGLQAARRLLATAGAYNLLGNSVGLRRGRIMPAATGAYAIAGMVAGLVTARRLGGAQGSYTVSGNSVALLAARRIMAAPGAYLTSGMSSGLRVARQLAVGIGTYSITGVSVSFGTGRYLGADAASYTLSGAAVSLRVGRHLVAQTAAFGLTGYIASFAVGRRLPFSAGAYATTGYATGLVYAPAPSPGRSLAAQSGTIDISGSQVAMRASRRMRAGGGGYAVVGGGAGLSHSPRLQPVPGGYAILGQDAGVAVRRSVHLSLASYLMAGFAVEMTKAQAPGAIDIPESRVYRGPRDVRVHVGRAEQRVYRERIPLFT